jgi:hypothetical protein
MDFTELADEIDIYRKDFDQVTLSEYFTDVPAQEKPIMNEFNLPGME